MTREEWLAELKHETPDREEPLLILGHEVDKANPEELYAALCWIEAHLIELLGDTARRAATDLRDAARKTRLVMCGCAFLAVLFVILLAL